MQTFPQRRLSMERNNNFFKKISKFFVDFLFVYFQTRKETKLMKKYTKNVSELSYKLEETSNMWQDKVPRHELVPAS